MIEGTSKKSDIADCIAVRSSDAADMAWLRKSNRDYHGDKIPTTTDCRDGFVLGGHAMPTNRSDTEEFGNVRNAVDARLGASVSPSKGGNGWRRVFWGWQLPPCERQHAASGEKSAMTLPSGAPKQENSTTSGQSQYWFKAAFKPAKNKQTNY